MKKILMVIDNDMIDILKDTQSLGYLLYQFEEMEKDKAEIIFDNLEKNKNNIINYINENNFHIVFLIDNFKYDDFSLLQYDDISIHYNNKFNDNEIIANELYTSLKDTYTTEIKKYKNNLIMNKSIATTIKVVMKDSIAKDLNIYKNITNLFWRD